MNVPNQVLSICAKCWKRKTENFLRTSRDFCRKDTGIIDSTLRKIKIAEFKCKFQKKQESRVNNVKHDEK